MSPDQTAELLGVIAKRQAGERHTAVGSDTGTAPAVVSIGYVAKTGMVLHDGIVILDAPPAITNVVMRWVEKQNKDDFTMLNIEAGQGGIVVR